MLHMKLFVCCRVVSLTSTNQYRYPGGCYNPSDLRHAFAIVMLGFLDGISPLITRVSSAGLIRRADCFN